MAQEQDEPKARGVEIPFRELSAEALQGVIESFVNREGTDYGAVERSLEEKVRDVRRQLERGEALLLFDPETESINLVPRDALPRR
ncbi:MAG: YheU family protein [Myxococcota bacterium]|nr:YheU family protein [Myxococcota bacterium]